MNRLMTKGKDLVATGDVYHNGIVFALLTRREGEELCKRTVRDS